MKFDTKVVRSGISPDPSTGAIVPPIYQSATYVLEEVARIKAMITPEHQILPGKYWKIIWQL